MQSAREQLGESDAPVEDEVVEAFDRIVDEGAQRLHRSWREVLTTGLAGGLEVATGVVALLAVYAATGSHLLAGLAFGIGFIALMLAKSELFTEGFLVPVTAVVAGRASAAQLGKLWAGTLVANLIGGWLVMWLVVHAFPELAATADNREMAEALGVNMRVVYMKVFTLGMVLGTLGGELADGRFLILPHPQVADYYAARATDTDAWLAGMRRARARAWPDG